MVDWGSLLIGFVPTAAVASIAGFIAYMKDKSITNLTNAHESRITQLKLDHETSITNLKIDHESRITQLKLDHEIEMRSLQDKLDTLKAYDTDLRCRRIQAYTNLWALLASVTHYNRPKPVTYELILDMWTSSVEWYYRTGGIYLSEESRPPYFSFNNEIRRILREEVLKKGESDEDIVYFYEQCRKQIKQQPIGEVLIPAESLKWLIRRGHALKVALVHDIGTRSPPRYPTSDYDNK
jgi:hypothetical protein